MKLTLAMLAALSLGAISLDISVYRHSASETKLFLGIWGMYIGGFTSSPIIKA